MNYSNIAKIKILSARIYNYEIICKDINELIGKFWNLLDYFHEDGRLFFVMGFPYDAVGLANQEESCDD